MRTPSNRLLYRVYVWDRNLNESNTVTTWTSEIKNILYDNSLSHIFDNQTIFPVKKVISQLKSSMFSQQRQFLKLKCETKPKLRTFITFKDFENQPPHVGKPLSFIERKTISKLRLGILPIKLETGRYLRPVVPENERTCYCNSGQIESEFYVLFECQTYSNMRESWLNKLSKPDNFQTLPPEEKLKVVLNIPENVKQTAQYLVSIMDLRRLYTN